MDTWPGRIKPDFEWYDRDLRDCIVYASLFFGEDDAGDIGSAMFLLSPFEILGETWPYVAV